MTRTLIIYINHPENIHPEDISEDVMNNVLAAVNDELMNLGKGYLTVDAEFEDEG